MCPQNPEIKLDFIAASLNNCERDRFGQLNSDKDSLVAKLSWNDFSTMLMGDNKSPDQEKVVDFYESIDPGFLNSTVLKLSHHGSLYGTTVDLVDAVSPEIVFFSSGMQVSAWRVFYFLFFSAFESRLELRRLRNIPES